MSTEKEQSLTDRVIKQVKEKALVGSILGMMGIGGTFLWNAGATLWNLPETVKDLKAKSKADSLYYSKIIKDNNKLDAAQDVDIYLLVDSLQEVKKRMNQYHQSPYGGIQ